MTDEKSASGSLDLIAKIVTVVSLGLAAFATWKALPYDAEIKRLQTKTQELDLALKQADADLRNLEASRKVTLELYQEVKNVIEKKDKDPREEDAVRVLVESLADDPFRWRLLNVIAAGAKSPDVKRTAAETSKYYREEAEVPQASAQPQPGAAQASGVGNFNVDFFYCESKKATSEPIVRNALSLKTSSDTGRWRARALPESINQQPGYGISSNVVRFTPPEERPVAEALAKLLETKGVNVAFQEISYPTPGYVSVFICQ